MEGNINFYHLILKSNVAMQKDVNILLLMVGWGGVGGWAKVKKLFKKLLVIISFQNRS